MGWELIRKVAFGVLRRRKALTLLCFIVAACVAMPLAYTLSKEPPRYRTSATILLEARPDGVPVFQELSPVRPLPVQLAILRSRALAEAVLDTLPPSSLQDLIEHPYYVDYFTRMRNTYRQLMGAEPQVDTWRRRVLTELQQARVAFDARNDGIVTIAVEASKPEVAIDIANTYIEALLARTRSFNIQDTRLSREFLEQQVADVKKNVSLAETSLRNFTNSHGGIKVPDRSQATVARLTAAENSLAEVQANLGMMRARLNGLRERAEAEKRLTPAAPAPAAPPSPAVRRLRDQLASLEASLLELRTRYTDEHPRVRAAKDRIAEVRAMLGGAVKETLDAAPPPSAVPPTERVNYTEHILTLETSVHSLVAQEQALRDQVAGLRSSLSGLNHNELQFSRLTREVESNRTLYGFLSDKLAATRIREQGEMKVVKVIDPPVHAVSATSDKRLKFLAGALGASAVVALAVPAGVELSRRRIDSAADVAAVVDLPALALVPRLHGHQPRFFAGRSIAGRPGGLDDLFVFTEAFRMLRVSVQLMVHSRGLRSVLVTSPCPGDGKSTVVTNLALAFVEAGIRVVLADTDFIRPTLHETMQVSPRAGTFRKALEDGVVTDNLLVESVDGVLVAAAGYELEMHARRALGTQRLKPLVEGLTERADLVLCDCAPVLATPESLLLATAVDAVILVVSASTTTSRDLVRAKSLLTDVGANILGVVINGVPASSLRRDYDRYYSAYHTRRREPGWSSWA